eukprot:CAMPEP_0185789310 /NCGR_PEP_ID=MMETSP1174-20130828/150337_1 /TAXON_ID=35687 /ORGANISM="Dictyocha speculum, Strain CCMP1381" /LENGTH=57 /DNA_ID=CAMNT_0028483373 /DNA_START=823 /DNA_END=996 /DNA_ORIENTATION=-
MVIGVVGFGKGPPICLAHVRPEEMVGTGARDIVIALSAENVMALVVLVQPTEVPGVA